MNVAAPYDVAAVRREFPVFARTVHGKPLRYLDSAATSQKPAAVLDAMRNFYETSNANVHRGVHTLGDEATSLFESSRERVARYIDGDPKGLVFLRNATEALNLAAVSLSRTGILGPGDRVVLSELEHHSNIVPWQLERDRAGFTIEAIRLSHDGSLDVEHAEELLRPPTKVLSITAQSNVLGTLTPLAELIALARRNDILVIVDGAQHIAHHPVSVSELSCDMYAFSGHKMYGPMGSGVLWCRPELLATLSPFLGGGSMIDTVSFEHTTFAPVPHRFEAGTPDVAAAVGLSAACDFIESLPHGALEAHENECLQYLITILSRYEIVERYGPADPSALSGAVSFNVGTVHAHDFGTICDRLGVALRVGHHCCQPLMRRLGVPATARASVGAYTTHEDLDAVGEAIEETVAIFHQEVRP